MMKIIVSTFLSNGKFLIVYIKIYGMKNVDTNEVTIKGIKSLHETSPHFSHKWSLFNIIDNINDDEIMKA